VLGTILLIILILIGSLATWPYSGGWGYYPSGGFGLLLLNRDHSSGVRTIISAPRPQIPEERQRDDCRARTATSR
jgi:hypothetical protein